VTIVATGACSNASSNPITPTIVARAVSTGGLSADTTVEALGAGQSKVDVCHRSSGPTSFTLLTIAASALDAHLQHGDGLVGHPVPGQPEMKFNADCIPIPFVPLTVTFSGLSGAANFSAFSGYSVSGVSVQPASGSWLIMTGYGHPAPAIIFQRSAFDPTTSASAQVTAGGSPFFFNAVDLYSSLTTIPYVLTGTLGGTTVFTVSNTVPNTFGAFVTVTNPQATSLIDTLTIQLSNPATPCCSNPVGLDNIVVSH
jgi:hypothetical protein